MAGILHSITALLLSVGILLIGHGLQLTLVPLYADALGWSATTIGYIGSAYYLGFITGCIAVPRLVARVGHIRVFGTLASTATAALLILGVQELPSLWMAARFVTGCCFAGIYMVIESWLNERAGTAHRGQVLSVYAIVALLAICAGQAFIGLALSYLQLAMAAAILISLGMVPVTLSRSPSPEPIPAVSFKFGEVIAASQVGVVGAFLSGFVTAGFWAMGPIVAKAQGLADDQIGAFMAATLLGGALFQWPIGRLSDHFDRRLVILVSSLLGIGVCILAPVLGAWHNALVYLPMFLFGGLTFPLYSVCLAHANDHTRLQLIDIASVMLLLNGGGSVLGPILVAALMTYTPFGMFLVAGIMLAVLAAWTLWRILQHRAPHEFFEPYAMVPPTTHAVTELAASDSGADPGPAERSATRSGTRS